MKRYWVGGHTKHRLRYHIVWVPKYRQRTLRGNLGIRVKGLIYEGCQGNRWWAERVIVKEDHVHLLIQIQPEDSVSEVVRVLKGTTSRVIQKEHPELQEFMWGDNFWAIGYFAETVGPVDEKIIKKYLDDQFQV